MLLRDIIEKEDLTDQDLYIEYRSISPEGIDCFTGSADYSSGEMKSLDGDDYELEDEIVRYELSEDRKTLKVWEELEWLE